MPNRTLSLDSSTFQVEARLRLDISRQPDDRTCGPTSLQAVYGYYGDAIELDQVIREVDTLEGGGTLGVHLATHALRRGYRAAIYTYNLQVFDPSWFKPPGDSARLRERLEAQLRVKRDPKLQEATRAYLSFLDLDGKILFEDLSGKLLRDILDRGCPVLTGLSATYLYRTPRERPADDEYDDVAGEPTGHFVVLCGYDRKSRTVLLADPLHANPLSECHTYSVGIDRLLGAILLGVVTYDANLLILEKVE